MKKFKKGDRGQNGRRWKRSAFPRETKKKVPPVFGPHNRLPLKKSGSAFLMYKRGAATNSQIEKKKKWKHKISPPPCADYPAAFLLSPPTSFRTSQPMRAQRHRAASHCSPFERKKKNGTMPCFPLAVAMFRCAFCRTLFFFLFFLGPTLLLLLLLLISAVSASSVTRPFQLSFTTPGLATTTWGKRRKETGLGELRLSTWRRRPAGDWNRSAGSCAF